MKRITIYDVAKEADVSLATVSRVINDRPATTSISRRMARSCPTSPQALVATPSVSRT